MGHHFDSELSRAHSRADLTDVYCFPSDRAGHSVFIVDSNPDARPGRSHDSVMGDGVIIRLHLAYDADFTDGVTFTFRWDDAAVVVGRAPGCVIELHETGEEIARLQPDQIGGSGDYRLFSGVVRDPFFGNSPGLRHLRTAFAEGRYDLAGFRDGINIFADGHVVSNVIEIPDDKLPDKLWYYASSALYLDGHWHQVNRCAHVLLPHVYLQSPSLVNDQNAGPVTEDHKRREPVRELIEAYAAAAGEQSDPADYAARIVDSVLPDAVPYVPGEPASYRVERVNGRPLGDDAMDTVMSWLTGTDFDDYVSAPGRSQDAFPFVLPDSEPPPPPE